MTIPAEIPFQQILDALLDEDTRFNPRYLYRLSDLNSNEAGLLRLTWNQVSLQRRKALMEDIEELNTNNSVMNFTELCHITLDDADGRVRWLAVHTLWDYDDKSFIPRLLDLAVHDPDSDVRAAAAGALGRFVYLGELEELSEKILRRVEETLLTIYHSKDEPAVRQAALESLGYSGREEVTALIEEAYASRDRKWIATALFAMGRSANESWQPQVMEMLQSNLPLLRSEAARAAGELEIAETGPVLLELLDDPDEVTRQAAIWSLSQIGGEGVREALEHLYEDAEDDDEMELIETALDNLSFNEDGGFTEPARMIPLLDIPDEDDFDDDEEDEYVELEDLDEIIDLFDEEDSPD